jgi:hypothetical protein
MPSALTSDVSIAENPTKREGDANVLIGRMDGALRKATNVVTGTTADRNNSSKKERPSNPSTVGSSAITEDGAVAAAGEEGRKKPNKHSMDYIVRSFVAGGLAGCAVSISPLPHAHYLPSWVSTLVWKCDDNEANTNPFAITGQDYRRTTRSSQNPLPNE